MAVHYCIVNVEIIYYDMNHKMRTNCTHMAIQNKYYKEEKKTNYIRIKFGMVFV